MANTWGVTKGHSVISPPRLRRALPISRTPHRLPRTLAHVHLSICKRYATGVDPGNEQPTSLDLLDGAKEESQQLDAGTARGRPRRGMGAVRQ